MTSVWILLEQDFIPADGVHASQESAIDALVKRAPEYEKVIREEVSKMPDGHVFHLDISGFRKFQIYQREISKPNAKAETL